MLIRLSRFSKNLFKYWGYTSKSVAYHRDIEPIRCEHIYTSDKSMDLTLVSVPDVNTTSPALYSYHQPIYELISFLKALDHTADFKNDQTD